MRCRWMPALALLAPVLLLPASAGDDATTVRALADRAVAAYEAGRSAEAIELFQQAIARIQKESEKGLEAFLPAAPDGFVREPVESRSGQWGSGEGAFTWTQVSARYVHEKEKWSAAISLSTSPQMIESYGAMLAMLDNPAWIEMANQDPKQSVTVYGKDGAKGDRRFRGLVTADESRANAWVVGKAVLVTAEVPKPGRAQVDALLDRLDWAGLAKFDAGLEERK